MKLCVKPTFYELECERPILNSEYERELSELQSRIDLLKLECEILDQAAIEQNQPNYQDKNDVEDDCKNHFETNEIPEDDQTVNNEIAGLNVKQLVQHFNTINK